MASKEDSGFVTSTDVNEAVDTPTSVDRDELEKARLDQRWREFCLNAEQYVAETTRGLPRAKQTA